MVAWITKKRSVVFQAITDYKVHNIKKHQFFCQKLTKYCLIYLNQEDLFYLLLSTTYNGLSQCQSFPNIFLRKITRVCGKQQEIEDGMFSCVGSVMTLKLAFFVSGQEQIVMTSRPPPLTSSTRSRPSVSTSRNSMSEVQVQETQILPNDCPQLLCMRTLAERVGLEMNSARLLIWPCKA